MAYAPSALLVSGSVADGIKGLSSSATDIDIINPLSIIVFVAFVIHYITLFFDIDWAAILNFVYQVFINSVQSIRNVLTVQTARATYNHFVHLFATSLTSPTNLLTALSRSIQTPYTLLHWLLRTPSKHTTQRITADTIVLPSGTMYAKIRGLPRDVSAPEVRRYLETVLFEQYSMQVRVELRAKRNANGPQLINDEGSEIDTSGPGLWKGTCVRAAPAGAAASGGEEVNMGASEEGIPSGVPAPLGRRPRRSLSKRA
ncbi:hypothetical protein OPT61_g2508 [Boeremia exigua]|uniref:Uncharacterized protein n=1 Tax=Boeremia exigua TaxID=749465 RepID=A0ACC2IL92_9PLEO|nr:hypothetical protein OPT61_g2508 [Boeremia exigua]